MNLFSWSSPAAAGGLNHVTLDWLRGRSRSPAREGRWGAEEPVLPHYTFLAELVCSITVPRADAGRMNSFLLHSQAECTKIQRREKHNKFRLQVRVPAGNKVEDEQWRLDGRRGCACVFERGLQLKKNREERCPSSLHLHFTNPLKSIYPEYFPQGCCERRPLHLK